jgi:hypothetical protein
MWQVEAIHPTCLIWSNMSQHVSRLPLGCIFHQITTTTISLCRHFEEEHFFYRHLFRKTIILNVIITFLNFKAKMLSIYPLLFEWCLNNAIKFLTLGKHNVVNLSITWCNLSPFKNSTRPSPSSLNKCSTRSFAYCHCCCWHLGWWVRKTSTLNKTLTCSMTFLYLPFEIWCSYEPR